MMEAPDFDRPIFAPVILGTSRQGRASEYAAHFVVDHVAKRPDMRTDLIDMRDIRLSIGDAGEAIKDPKIFKGGQRLRRAHIRCPRVVLDSNLKEYIHQ